MLRDGSAGQIRDIVPVMGQPLNVSCVGPRMYWQTLVPDPKGAFPVGSSLMRLSSRNDQCQTACTFPFAKIAVPSLMNSTVMPFSFTTVYFPSMCGLLLQPETKVVAAKMKGRSFRTLAPNDRRGCRIQGRTIIKNHDF